MEPTLKDTKENKRKLLFSKVYVGAYYNFWIRVWKNGYVQIQTIGANQFSLSSSIDFNKDEVDWDLDQIDKVLSLLSKEDIYLLYKITEELDDWVKYRKSRCNIILNEGDWNIL